MNDTELAKLDPAVFERASVEVMKALETKSWLRFCCCGALQTITMAYDTAYKAALDFFFKPSSRVGYWFGERINAKNQSERALALLFMAEIVRAAKWQQWAFSGRSQKRQAKKGGSRA